MKMLSPAQEVPEPYITGVCGCTTVSWPCAFGFTSGSMPEAFLDKAWREFAHLPWLLYTEILQNDSGALCGVTVDICFIFKTDELNITCNF